MSSFNETFVEKLFTMRSYKQDVLKKKVLLPLSVPFWGAKMTECRIHNKVEKIRGKISVFDIQCI